MNCIITSLKTFSKNVEVEKNNKKVIDFYEHCIQYYFNNDSTEKDNQDIMNAEQNFSKESNFFLNSSK